MKVCVALSCALTALFLVGSVCGGGGAREESKEVRIVYLTQGAWKMCLEADSGFIAPAQKPIDMGGFIHVSRIQVVAQYCDDFRLSHHVASFLIVIPDRVGSKCYLFSDCHSTVVMENENLVIGNSKCYNVLQGHYYHDQGVHSVTEFRISNMKPKKVICNYEDLDAIIRQKKLSSSGSVGDMFSPMEDIINGAVDKITSIVNQANKQINSQFNELENTVSNQINKVSDTIQEESAEIMTTTKESIGALSTKLDNFKEEIVNGVGIFGRYVHTIFHVLEFLRVCLVIYWLYKLEKKATGVFNFLKWIWSKIHPGHHHNENNPHRAP